MVYVVHICNLLLVLLVLPTAVSTIADTDGCDPSMYFRCPNSGICIPLSWLCDMRNDCQDNSDEGTFAGCPGTSAHLS